MWMSGLIRCLNNLVDFASRKINDKRVKRNISEDFEGYIIYKNQEISIKPFNLQFNLLLNI